MRQRISLNRDDVMRIYEWRLGLIQFIGEEDCASCNYVMSKLKRFLGKDADWLEEQCKKHPYNTATEQKNTTD